MINWRNGKGGFVGGLKTAIKGVFQYAHSITSSIPVTPGLNTGVLSRISSSDVGLLSSISADDVGLISVIEQNFGVYSRISSTDKAVISIINNEDTGIESVMS